MKTSELDGGYKCGTIKEDVSIMVSVIIPVYNVENYIAPCLEAVLQQTYRDLEILLIDDGSTDRSSAICQEYAAKDDRIRYCRTENRGLSEARNLGMQLCTGEYVSFVDSDDRLHPQAAELMLRAMKEHNVSIVKSDPGRISDKENPPFEEFVYENLSMAVRDCEADIEKSFENPVLRAVWGALYSKSSLEGLIFEKGRYYEDIMFSYQALSRLSKMVRIEAPLYQYRIRGGSIVNHKVAGKADLDLLIVLRQAVEFFAKSKPEIAELAKAELLTECASRKILALHNGCDPKYEEALYEYIHECVKVASPKVRLLWNRSISIRRRLFCFASKFSFPFACWVKYKIMN